MQVFLVIVGKSIFIFDCFFFFEYILTKLYKISPKKDQKSISKSIIYKWYINCNALFKIESLYI